MFGYEQALGYLVAARPRDKDGITAAVLMAEVAALAKAEGVTLQDRLDDIARRFGRYVTKERSLRMEPSVAAARVSAMRSHPPDTLAGRPVDQVTDFPEANLLRLVCGATRVQVRPSGTEPKVKVYGEGVEEDPGPLIDALADLLLAAGVGVAPGAIRREAGWARRSTDPYRRTCSPRRGQPCPAPAAALRRNPVLERLASACFRHRWRVVGLWVVALVGLFAISSS